MAPYPGEETSVAGSRYAGEDRKRNGKRVIRRGHELGGKSSGEQGVAEVGVRSCYAAGDPELSLEIAAGEHAA